MKKVIIKKMIGVYEKVMDVQVAVFGKETEKMEFELPTIPLPLHFEIELEMLVKDDYNNWKHLASLDNINDISKEVIDYKVVSSKLSQKENNL